MNDDASSPYRKRQPAKDKAYREAYDQWLASLSDDERDKLQAMGLDKPHLEGLSAGFSERDPADAARVECELDLDDEEDSDMLDTEDARSAHLADTEAPAVNENEPRPRAEVDTSSEEASETRHDLVRRLVGELLCQGNARLSVECLALVSGLLYEGDSLTEIAKRHGVTRAAVSKRCIELTQNLNLKPSRALRSLAARTHYRDARILSLLRAK